MNFLKNLHKLDLMDNSYGAITKLVSGNPGAVNALTAMVLLMQKVDPSNPLGNSFPILAFDAVEIYGTDIYVLWSDVCHKDSSMTIAVLRAVELDIITPEVVREAASVQDFSSSLPLESILEDVKKLVPDFKIA